MIRNIGFPDCKSPNNINYTHVIAWGNLMSILLIWVIFEFYFIISIYLILAVIDLVNLL